MPAATLMEHSRPVLWSAALSRYEQALADIAAKKKDPHKLHSLDAWYLDAKPAVVQASLDKATLCKIVEWKLTRGTFRPGLLQKAQSNSEQAIAAAFAEARKRLVFAETLDAKHRDSSDATTAPAELHAAAAAAVKILEKELTGVGPATGSAVLARAFPGVVAFMSDDAMLGCGLFQKKADIKYTMQAFRSFNELVQNKAREINAKLGKQEWTGDMVARALWTESVLKSSQSDAPLTTTAAKRPAAAAGGVAKRSRA